MGKLAADLVDWADARLDGVRDVRYMHDLAKRIDDWTIPAATDQHGTPIHAGDTATFCAMPTHGDGTAPLEETQGEIRDLCARIGGDDIEDLDAERIAWNVYKRPSILFDTGVHVDPHDVIIDEPHDERQACAKRKARDRAVRLGRASFLRHARHRARGDTVLVPNRVRDHRTAAWAGQQAAASWRCRL